MEWVAGWLWNPQRALKASGAAVLRDGVYLLPAT